MPVPAVVGVTAGYRNDMPHTGRDVPVASRTHVAFGGLVRLDEPDLDVVVVNHGCVLSAQPMTAHATSAATTTKAAMTIR